MTKKIRVLVITDFFYPHWTGISKSLFYLTASLVSKIDFTVLTVRHIPGLRKEENLKGVKILREPYLLNISRVKYSSSLVLRSIKEIQKHNVILINSPNSNILLLSLIARLLRKKLLIFHQGDLILPKGMKNKLIEKIFDFFTFFSFLLANKVSTYTLDYAENSRLLKFFLHKFTPLLMPVIFNANKENDNDKISILELKKQGKILFGFAGRFVEEKGFDILFEAIPLVLKKIPNAHFVFAGETKMPYENFFEKTAEKIDKLKTNLTFLGLLDEQKLIEFYKMIDFIIVPSRSDCFPLVQMEAAILKNPAITADIPGARVLVQKTGFGLIFKAQDFVDLADKIMEAVKKRKILLAQHSRVLKMFDNANNAQQIRDFIEK